MADYYPLIAKAVAALVPNTPEARQGIYERARTALSRQLASIDPPPAAAVVDREIGALEGVIRRIESEHAGQRSAVPQKVTVPAGPEPVDESAPDAATARPQAPTREKRKASRKPLYAVFGALGLVAVAAIATLAYLRRNEPPAMANQRPSPTPPAARPPQAAKTDDRVAPGQAEPASRPSAPALAQPPAATAPPAAPPVTASQPAIAVANKLVLAMEGTDRPENVAVRQGVVVWRTEMVSGTQGQPPQLAIKALLDVPEARLQGEMTVQRNRDPAFPASHTIQVQFTPAAGSEFGAVRNLSQIEMRQAENQPGYPLAGQGIAVMENLFLLALGQTEPALSRNVEMMRGRPIVYIEFQGAANRRGALILEKGISGQQAFDEAFRNWQ
jgi:hypothetical protein